jgi:exopolyphosphatase/guanosine-5'-triphosphate,3'-diphosphate pyrophosphatase
MTLAAPGLAEYEGRSAVIDIGSNSVRMVAYDRDSRSLEPIFNEKAMSGLGRDLFSTGALNPEGKTSALKILRRFRAIAESMEIGTLRAVATAAAREASDGDAFIREASDALGAPISVIPGEEEARLSALGILCGVPDADGVMADLGGGSLELADVRDGAVHGGMSVPLGPLALGDLVGGKKEAARIKELLAPMEPAGAKGRTLYLVGGAWRSLAKHDLISKSYPINIIHQYALSTGQAREIAKGVASLTGDAVTTLASVSQRRQPTLPYASRLLLALISKLKPAEVMFSAYGLREGVQFEAMDTDVRARDPLVDYCRRLGRSSMRVPFDGDRLADWLSGAFGEDHPAPQRMIRAACWLSDISGHDHPDYRGHHAAARALHLPAGGLRHEDRVFLAAAVYARYHGFGMERTLGDAVEMIEEATRKRAVALGLALRLAHAIEPGGGHVDADGVDVPTGASLRRRFRLVRGLGVLRLLAEPGAEGALGETALKRFNALAKALELEAVVSVDQSAVA